MKSTAGKDVEAEADVCTGKDNDASNYLNLDRSTAGMAPSSSSEDPTPHASDGVEETDAGNGSATLSSPPHVIRASRRKFATILDEFWGHLFDYHGKAMQDADAESLTLLLGELDLITDRSADSQTIEASKSTSVTDPVWGSPALLNSWGSGCPISSPDLTFGVQMGAMGALPLPQVVHSPQTNIPSSTSTLLEQNAKFYPNFNLPPYYGSHYYQPAHFHGYHQHSSIPLDPWRFPRSSASVAPNYADSVMHVRDQNALGSLRPTSMQSPTVNRLSSMTVEKSYYDPTYVDAIGRNGSSTYSKNFHSSPDISAQIAESRGSLLNEATSRNAAGNQSYLGRLAPERSHYEHSQLNLQREAFTMQPSMDTNAKPLWSKQPSQQLFGVPSAELNKSGMNTGRRSSGIKDDIADTLCEAKLLQSLRFCIMKLLKLECSEWFFSQSGGCDETLIDQVAAALRVSQGTTDDTDADCMSRLPNCGDECVWQASLGILDPAFSKPRELLVWCTCLEKAGLFAKPMPGTFTTPAVILKVIEDVMQAVSGRKGKGKENLFPMLKRYRRRLSNMPSAGKY